MRSIAGSSRRAPSVRESIKVAEAAKVIENTQRDLNIALINELAIIFNKMGIDTQAVLAAAGTKWNFLHFRPGLVGGHCIGVDPYYLTHKAQMMGYHPEMILAGRRINDGMGAYVAGQLVKAMIARRIQVDGARVLVLGLAFKENCPDLRNTRVVDVIAELEGFGCRVDVHDPWVDAGRSARRIRARAGRSARAGCLRRRGAGRGAQAVQAGRCRSFPLIRTAEPRLLRPQTCVRGREQRPEALVLQAPCVILAALSYLLLRAEPR